MDPLCDVVATPSVARSARWPSLAARRLRRGARPGCAGKPREWKLSVAVGPAFALGKAGERWAKLIARTQRRHARGQAPSGRVARAARSRARIRRACATAPPISPSARRCSGRRRSTSSPSSDCRGSRRTTRELAALATGADAANACSTRDRRAPVWSRSRSRRWVIARSRPAPRRCARRTICAASRCAVAPTSVPHRSLRGARCASRARCRSPTRRRRCEAATLDAQEGPLATFAAARLDALGLRNVMLLGRASRRSRSSR